jgi:hypothetical protein
MIQLTFTQILLKHLKPIVQKNLLSQIYNLKTPKSTVRTVPKSNREIVERGKINTSNTHILYMSENSKSGRIEI